MDNRHFSYITKLRKKKPLCVHQCVFQFCDVVTMAIVHKDILATVGYRPAMKVKK